MKIKIIILLSLAIISTSLVAQSLEVRMDKGHYIPQIVNQGLGMEPVADGLWSIALDWQDDWPADWQHASATKMTTAGPWTILEGVLPLQEGSWKLRDAYRAEGNRIKCIRRFEWTGKQRLDKVTLSVRWAVAADDTKAKAFFPNMLYYGNPSGEKNGSDKVPAFHGTPGELALFEEHRYTMPFAALEWKVSDSYAGAALHTLPGLVPGGNLPDQWWSLGAKVSNEQTELLLLSGPVAYNGKKNQVKALQSGGLDYGNTYLSVQPGTVIEKTFYLEVFPAEEEGTAFQCLFRSIWFFVTFGERC